MTLTCEPCGGFGAIVGPPDELSGHPMGNVERCEPCNGTGRAYRLSVAVMAHPKREAMVADLVARLDREPVVVWDQRNDRWDTGRRSQLAFDPNATHHLVVQDDAMIPRDLVAGIERALPHVTDEGAALCLYIGKVRPHAGRISRAVAKAEGCSWLVMRDLHWGVGIVLPTPIIETVIRDQDPKTSIEQYDRRISRWLVMQRRSVWYPWPSLVDHRDSPSLINHGEGRHAHQFLGEDRSALDVDWGQGVLQIPSAREPQALPMRVSRRPVVQRRRGAAEVPGPG